MKKIFFITLLIGFCCTSCNKDDEPTPYVNDSYKQVDGTIWCDDSSWQYGRLDILIFDNNNNFEWRIYGVDGKAKGCDYLDKTSSYFEYSSSIYGKYYLDENNKKYNAHYAYRLLLDLYNEGKITEYALYLWNNELNGYYYIEIFDSEDNLEFSFTVNQLSSLSDAKYIYCNGQEYNSSTGGSGGSGGGGTSDPTAGYTITRTSVCAIYLLDSDQNNGDKYAKEWYKWVSDLTGKVILSRSSSNSAYWVGVASKNNDSKCGKWPVYSYSYKVVDYTPVGGAWYYYFN